MLNVLMLRGLRVEKNAKFRKNKIVCLTNIYNYEKDYYLRYFIIAYCRICVL